MADLTQRIGSAGLPPSNLLAGNTYNPLIGPTTAHPDSFPPGTPVVQSLLVDKTVIPGRANNVDTSSLTGLAAIPCAVGDHGLIQFEGVLTLTELQWDAVTGGTGGLVRGVPYYLGNSPAEGRLSISAPVGPGTFVVQVGVALSSQDLLIQICAPKAN